MPILAAAWKMSFGHSHHLTGAPRMPTATLCLKVQDVYQEMLDLYYGQVQMGGRTQVVEGWPA
jgi:hypothetical protein